MGVVKLTEVIPDCRFGRNDVWLIAAIDNDAMRALRGAKMFAAKIPTAIHQFNGVECAAALPGSDGRVRRFAIKKVLDRDEAAPLAVASAIRRGEFTVDVRTEND